jgi:DNA-binding LacI/PurR family transcriptional regulator
MSGSVVEITIKVVARQAGVSKATVSRVINGSEDVASSTRVKVLNAIQDLNYKPNREAANLRRKQPQVTGATNTYLPAKDGLEISSAGRSHLAHEIAQLRRELERLRKHTQRIQHCLDAVQQACSRPLSPATRIDECH